MAETYIDYERLAEITPEQFQQANPFPWINPAGVLSRRGYERLREALPDVAMFEPVFGKKRKHGQQSHDRHALEYKDGLDLPRPWQEFIDELRAEPYQDWTRRMFGVRKLHMQFHWHYTPHACSVSPHCDAKRKLGSHIFYFNTEEDWDPSWGGETLILDDGGRFSRDSAPAFEDFDAGYGSNALGNHSLLFASSGNSWHGVKEVVCPEGYLRKVFIVVINRDHGMYRLERMLKG